MHTNRQEVFVAVKLWKQTRENYTVSQKTSQTFLIVTLKPITRF